MTARTMLAVTQNCTFGCCDYGSLASFKTESAEKRYMHVSSMRAPIDKVIGSLFLLSGSKLEFLDRGGP